MQGQREKPKGMHEQTFEVLKVEHDRLVHPYLMGLTQRVERLEGDAG